jgi:tetratricopeptide (TPR) repeat protein
VRDTATTAAIQGTFYSRAAAPARYAIERGQWAEAAALEEPETSNFPYADAIRYFARALGAARSGHPEAADKDVARLREIGQGLKAAKNEYWTTEVEVERGGAEAWVVFVRGDRERGLSLMRAAADLEDTSEKAAVSPGRLIPARELLADMLLESGRPAEALVEYEASQLRDPKRFRGYWGAGTTAAQAGNKDKARYHFARLVEMAGYGDPRSEVAKARDYLAAN